MVPRVWGWCDAVVRRHRSPKCPAGYAVRTRRSAVLLNLDLSTNRSGAYSILRRERKHSTLNETI